MKWISSESNRLVFMIHVCECVCVCAQPKRFTTSFLRSIFHCLHLICISLWWYFSVFCSQNFFFSLSASAFLSLPLYVWLSVSILVAVFHNVYEASCVVFQHYTRASSCCRNQVKILWGLAIRINGDCVCVCVLGVPVYGTRFKWRTEE